MDRARPTRRSLLRQSGGFRKLWAARTISVFGDSVVLVALVNYVYEQKHSGVWVGLILLAETLPRLLGPVAGALVDRLDQRRVMVWCDLGQAVVFAAIAVLRPSVALLWPLVFVAGLLATVFMPAGKSLLPQLVDRDELPAANTLLASGTYTALAFGPAFGGVLVAATGMRTAVAFDAASFVVSAAFALRLAAGDSRASAAGSRILSEALAGLAYVRRERVARAVALGLFLTVTFAALDSVGGVFLAKHTFRAGAVGYGVLVSSYGVGMVLGQLALLRLTGRLGAATTLLSGMTLMAIGNIATGLSPVYATAAGAQAFAGAGNGLENVANDTLLQQHVSQEYLGRAFGTVYSAAFLGELIAYSLGGVLLGLTSARALFVIAGAGIAVSLLILRVMLRDSLRTDKT